MSSGRWAALGLIEVLFFVQHLWLLPVLDHRAQAIILSSGRGSDGQIPASSSPHAVYVALEVAKLGVLLGLGYSLLRVLLTGGSNS